MANATLLSSAVLMETVAAIGAATLTAAAGAEESTWVDWVWWFVFWLIKLVFWIFGATMFGVWWCQGYLLYLPSFAGRTGDKRQIKFNQAGLRSPAELQLPFEEHYISTKDSVLIHAWLVLQDNYQMCPTLIFFSRKCWQHRLSPTCDAHYVFYHWLQYSHGGLPRIRQ
jgi:hypothetical protein